MHVLFVHRAGSGQFAALIGSLVAEGVEVTLITERLAQEAPGVRQLVYSVDDSTTQHPALAATECHLRTGEAVARLKRSDPPDVVLGHIGWGGMTFARDALPDAGLIGYCEYDYHNTGSDLDFGIDEPIPAADRQRIAVCHDGIDTRFCQPDANASFALPDGRVLAPGMPVVTFVARDLDPYRGYPEFIRAAALLAARHPDALFVVVGGDGSGYGRPRSDGGSWREAMLAETGLGDRIVHIPCLRHEQLIRLFQVSAVHAYLTVPFVLSWSLLEAMACGCLIVSAETEPVKEVIRDGINGLLAPFHDTQALAERIDEALSSPTQMRRLRRVARETVIAGYERERCIARQIGWIHRFGH